MKSVCFTGHRPNGLCGYNLENYSTFNKQLYKFLIDLYNKDVRIFVTGGAQGFDQLSFWAVNKLKSKYSDIQNIVYVPYKGQELRWGKFGPFSQNDYNQMLSKADKVIYLCENTPENWTQALMYRNHKMVDDTDFVIALYSGQDWQDSKGGTAECMRYATRHNKEIIQLDYKIIDDKLVI